MTVPSSTFQVDEISNSTASEDDRAWQNICQRTGFQVKAGELVREWDGSLVRPESYERRNEQDFIRPKAESLTGPIRPEPDDVFISTSVAPSDL